MSTDRDALNELFRNTTPGATHQISHYLYFPSVTAAKSAIPKITSAGYQTEDRMGADGINWLVLVTQSVVPSEPVLAKARQELEAIAAAGGGEYDGWEAEVADS